ncbi:ion channel [uncultured Aquitalea sp.]|uniref:ion channel n=1 Tax=uncultured Aquitalea sp. TaxID=540272 RepID=UPI0025DB1223|nr:ion channel [uncultured Aquitalea sp.]
MKTRYQARRVNVGDRDIFIHRLPSGLGHDLYHYAMTLSWPRFYLAIGGLFLLLNTVFATLYALQPGSIANQFPTGFWGGFFFSVETLATVGYGDMHPQTLYAHVVSTLEIFLGMMSIALVTGVTFSRFSLPRSRIVFSQNPVVRRLDGRPTLMLRAANARQSYIVDADAQLNLLVNHVTPEGLRIRQLKDLKLQRRHHPLFVLSWTLMHVIDEHSPLYGMSAEEMARKGCSFILSISGMDDTTRQTAMGRHLFSHGDIRWNHRYADLLETDDAGFDHVDFGKLQEVMPLSAEDEGEAPTG